MAQSADSCQKTGIADRKARSVLSDDPIYGWHLDLDVEAKLGGGETRRTGYRCLFVVENREQPLFLAVVEG